MPVCLASALVTKRPAARAITEETCRCPRRGPAGSSRGGNPRRRGRRILLAPLAVVTLWPLPSAALDPETRNQDLIDLSRVIVQQSVSYVPAVMPNPGSDQHAYTFETEISYAATDWYQFAIALPAAFAARADVPGNTDRQFSWSGIVVRNVFITPRSGERSAFAGLMVQLAYAAPGAAVASLADTHTRFALGLTPIAGFAYDGTQLVVSPTLAFGLGAGALTSLSPAARLTKTIATDLDIGIEYNAVLGPIGAFVPPGQQVHIIYGVTDFKLAGFSLDLGVGYGVAATSRGLAVKTAIGHGF